jgi:sugar lactone lactonase YvrE
MSQATQISEPLATHGEGPVWLADRKELRWVDMLNGDILILHADQRIHRQSLDTPVVAAIRPRSKGGCVLAIERGFAFQPNLDSDTFEPLERSIPLTDLRMNDGGCDPDGRFYCGSMGYDAAPHAGTLYRLNLDHSVEPVLTGLTISNGLDWSPDGAHAYFVDSATNQIDVFDYDQHHGLTDRRRFVAIPAELGQPDGLTVDLDEHIWVALWNGSAVHRYRPDGTLDDIVQLPTAKPTACTFGGTNGDELFITTSRIGVADDHDQLAGALFQIHTGTSGQPTRPYMG